jgi:F0F1-type ATP synthase membrane subunit c/vacuolar-type H+-ATPase subunit K
LISFAAAIFVGVTANNPLNTVLWRGLLVMVGCYVIGLMIGGVAQHVIDRHIEQHKAAYPIPDRGDLGLNDPASTADPAA